MSDDAPPDAKTKDGDAETPEGSPQNGDESDNADNGDEAGGEGGGEAGDEGGGEGGPASGLKARLAGKGKIIAITTLALVLIGGGAGAYFSAMFTAPKLYEATIELPGPPVYYELPRITVDIKPSPRRARPFIRLTVQVQLEGEPAKTALEEKQVEVMDALQSHLRATTAPELSDRDGTERLRADFVDIINRVIAPQRALTVLYKDILVR